LLLFFKDASERKGGRRKEVHTLIKAIRYAAKTDSATTLNPTPRPANATYNATSQSVIAMNQ